MAILTEARRSQYLLGALVVAHLIVISGQVEGGGGASLLERGVLGVLSPLIRGVGAALAAISEGWHGYVDLRAVHEHNLALRVRVRGLEDDLLRQRLLAREAERLHLLLDLRERLPFESLAAEVVTREGLPWYRTILVNQGEEAGVRLNAPVLSPAGVVGRVIAVGPRLAKVQTLLDRDCRVGTLLVRSRAAGVVEGQVGRADEGSFDLVMKYVPALSDVVAGDMVVTSGFDRIFPKGLVVGRVHSVGAAAGLFREVRVAPSAGFERLEEVLILRPADEAGELTRALR